MTQEQVDTGYGMYGPKTKAAYAAAQQSQNASNTPANTPNDSKNSLFLSKNKANDYLNYEEMEKLIEDLRFIDEGTCNYR
jgi:hypothetical protein